MKWDKDNIQVGISLGVGLGVIVMLGAMVIHSISNEQAWLEGFCVDKNTGVYDIRGYNISTIMLQYSYDNITCINGRPLYKIDTTMQTK